MHTLSSKWHAPRSKYVSIKKKKHMQMITDKRKIDSGRGPEMTAVKKKQLNSPLNISESDEFILIYTSFLS